ncbi:MAG: hypothetical protein AB8E15_13070 [Bdellovibrionales bacterium]
MKNFLLIFIVGILVGTQAFASSSHPRVSELEDKLMADATKYLNARFPDLPFYISIKINPLRRSFSQGYQIQGENLPFYALDEEAIKDEWDDPTVSLYSLLTRVKDVNVSLSLPSSLKEAEIAEIKSELNVVLRLVPSRDKIEITQRKWQMLPHLEWIVLGVAAVILFYLLGLFVVSRLSMRKMADVISAIKSDGSASASGGGISSGGPSIVPSSDIAGGSASKISGDIKFNDMIKIREVASEWLENISSQPSFFRIDNMMHLEELGEKNPRSLGALVRMFPVNIQKELFSFGKGNAWLDAFSKPGELTSDALEIIEELGRVRPGEYEANWEKLLIQLWRLDLSAEEFLRSLPEEDTMVLLKEMPKNLGVPLARSIFPGNWGSVLRVEEASTRLDAEKSEMYYQLSLEHLPLKDFDVVQEYRTQMELVDYLDTVSETIEKEVYVAAGESSMLNQLRPPFYKILENEGMMEEEFIKFVKLFKAEQWALALFNVKRDARKSIDQYFGEKEKFLFMEYLVHFDRSNPSTDQIGAMRALMGTSFQKYCSDLENKKQQVVENIDEGEREDEQVA